MLCGIVLVKVDAQPFWPTGPTLGADWCGWIAWADYDADGDTDALLAGLASGAPGTSLYRNQGSSVFQLATLPPTPHAYDGFHPFWDDDNRDGRLDMLLTESDESSRPVMRLFHQLPDRSFADSGVRLTGEPILWADLDNDGDLDILASAPYSPGTSWLYWNQGTNNYTQTTPGFGTYLKLAVAVDLDGDGDLDLLLRGSSAQTTQLLRNDGNGRITDTGITLPARAVFAAAWVDADGDGKLDLLNLGWNTNGIPVPKLYHNDGGLEFLDTQPELPTVESGTLCWADCDQDGDADVLVNCTARYVGGLFDPRPRLFLNDGAQHYVEGAVRLPTLVGGDATFLDLEGDGGVDFTITGGPYPSGYPLGRRLYRNDGNRAPTVPAAPSGLLAQTAGNRAMLRWDAPAGWAGGTSYAVRVGTQPGLGDVISPLASSEGRRFAAGLGNTQASSRWYITGLAPGTYYWSVQTVDGAFHGSRFAPEASFVVSDSLPPPPSITALAPQYTDEDVATPPVNFAVGPASSLSNLTLTVEASNPTLAPASGIVIGGEGTNRWLTITPGTNQFDTSLITVRVTDAAGQSASASFLLTVSPVNDPPTFTLIPNQSTYEGSKPLTLLFGADDVDTAIADLSLKATSSNPDLIPATGLKVSLRAPTNGSLVVTPQTNRTGSAVISLTVGDGMAETSAAFVVAVLERPFVPTADHFTNFAGGLVGWADYDRDGDLDLLLKGSLVWRDFTVCYYRNEGNGRLVDTGLRRVAVPASSASFVDYDRDGDVDAILGGYEAAEILRNDGHAGFTSITNVPGLTPVLRSNPEMAWGDADNDGDLDMVYSRSPEETKILFNNNGSFSPSGTLSSASGVLGPVALGDYDGDAVLDLASSGTLNSGAVRNTVLHGLGGGKFSVSGIALDQSAAGRIGFCDLDGDGRLDLWQYVPTYLNDQPARLLLYRNLDGGQFATPVAFSVGHWFDPSSLRWADFDGDGDLDFLVKASFPASESGTSYTSELIYCRNEGGFQFTCLGGPLPNAEAAFLGIGDFDNDGDVDLSAAVTEGPRSVRMLTNRLSQLNPPPGSPAGLSARVEGQSVWLSWRPSTDLNQRGGLTYNVRVGTRPGAVDVVSPTALTNGYRLVADFGNAGVRTNFYLTNLVGETFYWSVQAVDNCYIGGAFASEQDYVVNLPGNQPPVISEIADQTTDEETALTLTFIVHDDRTPAENLRLRVLSADPFLLPVANVLFGGSGTNRTLTLLPATNQTGQTKVAVEATDAVGASATRSFLLTVKNVNDSPFISAIPDQTNLYSAEATAVDFTIYDPDTPADQLELSAASSNPALVPATNIVLSGVGTNRLATIRAGAPQEGETTITVTVRDPHGATTSTSFLLALRRQMFRLRSTPFAGVASGWMAWGDHDNDGDLDLALSGQGINQTAIYRNDGNGVFVKAETDFPTVDGGGVEWGDFDNDGDLDLLIHGRGWYADGLVFRIYRNLGRGQFELASSLTGRYGPAAWGDCDNDGKLDIVSSGETWDGQPSASVVLHNDGNGRFRSVTSFPQTIANAGLLASGGVGPWLDVDGDGNLDLLLRQFNGFAWQDVRLTGQGSGQFTNAPVPWTGVRRGWADFDNDGRPDVLESADASPNLRVLRNTKGGAFVSWGEPLQSNRSPDGVALGDFNNDGFLDVLSSSYEINDRTRLFQSQATGTWAVVTTPFLDFRSGSASWADVDNDGDLDLLISGEWDYPSTPLYLNDQPQSNSPPSAPRELQALFTSNTVFLSWQPATDAEQTAGLTYNVRIGSAMGAVDVLSPMSAADGWRLVPKTGNAGWLTHKLVSGLQRGQTYYWSVQAVDNCYAGSAFATEASCTFGEVPLLGAVPNQAMDEDGLLEVPLAVNDPDGDANAIILSAHASDSVLVPPAGLSVSGTGTNRSLRIQPATDQNGTTTIEVKATDVQGGLALRSVALNVRPVNDPPRVQNQHFTLAEDTILGFTLAVEDPESDPMTYTTFRRPRHGTLTVAAPQFTYQPRPDFFGDDSCEFLVSDAHGASNSLEVSFEVTPVEDVLDQRLGIRFLSDGSPFLSFSGEPYQIYLVETSTNLLDWVTLWSHVAAAGRIEFIGEPAAPGAARFYRARRP